MRSSSRSLAVPALGLAVVGLSVLSLRLWLSTQASTTPALPVEEAPEVGECDCPDLAMTLLERRAEVEQPPPSCRPATESGTADSLLESLAAEQSPVTRERIVEALGITGDERAVPALAELAASAPSRLRTRAAEALGRIGGTEAVAVLVGLTEATTRFDREAAVAALGRAASADAKSWLEDLARTDHMGLAEVAMSALAEAGGPAAESFLRTRLSAGGTREAVAAARALAMTGTATARGALVAAVEAEGGALRVRAAALRGLASFADPQNRQLLERYATGDDPTLASAAIDALGEAGDAQAVGLLRSLALTGRDGPAASAATALSTIGTDDARDALIDALAVGPSHVTWAAATGIATIGDERARDALLQAALVGGERGVAAISALGDLPADEATLEALTGLVTRMDGRVTPVAMSVMVRHLGAAALPALEDVLSRCGRNLRGSVLTSIGAAGGPRAQSLLLDVLQHGAPEDQSMALAALESSGGALSAEVRTVLVSRLKSGATGMYDYQTPYALARIGGPEANEALLSAVGDGASYTSMNVVNALVSSGDPSAIEALVDMTRDEVDPIKKTGMIQALASSDSPAARQLLRDEALGDGPDSARALEAMAYASSPFGQDIALEALGSQSPDKRRAALVVLGQDAGPEVVPYAVSALRDADPSVQEQAVATLDQIGGPEATRALLSAYEGSSDEMKDTMSYALARSGDPEALELLLGQLGRGETERYATFSALASSGSNVAIERLLELGEQQTEVGQWVHGQLGMMGYIPGFVPEVGTGIFDFEDMVLSEDEIQAWEPEDELQPPEELPDDDDGSWSSVW